MHSMTIPASGWKILIQELKVKWLHMKIILARLSPEKLLNTLEGYTVLPQIMHKPNSVVDMYKLFW